MNSYCYQNFSVNLPNIASCISGPDTQTELTLCVLYFIECIVKVVCVCICALCAFVSVCVFNWPGKNDWFRV